MNCRRHEELDPFTGCIDPITLEPREVAPVAGIDREQLFAAVVVREETVPHLYGRFGRENPPPLHYTHGSRPALEAIVDETVTGNMTAAEKAAALGQVVFQRAPHALLHEGEIAPPDRGWSEEQLLEDTRCWCNEQVRIFVCLCHVAGIPARMVALFPSHRTGGHVTAEFWNEDHWALFDVTYNVRVEIAPGRFASAREIQTDRDISSIADRVYAPAVATFDARVPPDQQERYRSLGLRTFDFSPNHEKFAGLQIWDYPIE